MQNTKETLVAAFALFSLFFGAGNLILPPLLGFKSGLSWWSVSIGFFLSAVLIPILAIIAHARLQGTLFDFGAKVSPIFSIGYCYSIYAISIALPAPRTASVTHEMAIDPLFGVSPWVTGICYFGLVLLFALFRSEVLDWIGKWLTPFILLILFSIIGMTLYQGDFSSIGSPTLTRPFSDGLLEGYQTFDAIGGVVVGGVLIVSIHLKDPASSFAVKRRRIIMGGILAGLALMLVYAGLIASGALVSGRFEPTIARTSLLRGLSSYALGESSLVLLGLLITLACFTTAVGIVTGTADFVRSRHNGSKRAYQITVFIACVIGILVGRLSVDVIIAVALPALMLLYPITIVLVLLNVIPEKYASRPVFRTVVPITLLCSLPDFLESLGLTALKKIVGPWLPLTDYSLGWLLPAAVTLLIVNIVKRRPN